MTPPRIDNWKLVSSAALVAVLGCFALAARAGAPPSSRNLTYSGRLQDEEGHAITGRKAIDFRLWDAREAGNEQCTLLNPRDSYELGADGRFSIQLTDACQAAVKAHAELWVELRVAGEALPRAQLGAVPYAVEADHALAADTATRADTANAAGNELAETLASLQSQVSALQEDKPRFQARNTSSKVIEGNAIVWAAVDVDNRSAFDTSTGVYVVPVAGTYQFYFDLLMPNAPAGEFRYALTKNDEQVHIAIAYKATAGVWQSAYGSYMLSCEVGDKIGVRFVSGGGETYSDGHYNVFNGHML